MIGTDGNALIGAMDAFAGNIFLLQERAEAQHAAADGFVDPGVRRAPVLHRNEDEALEIMLQRLSEPGISGHGQIGRP